MNTIHIFKKSILFFVTDIDTISSEIITQNYGGNVMNINLNQADKKQTLNLKKLNVISKLHDNWNGYGAEPLQKKLIALTADLIRKLYIQPEIFPTADGTIQLEFEKDNGDYLEFQFSGKGLCDVFRLRGDNEEYFKARDDSFSINHLVEDFYGFSF